METVFFILTNISIRESINIMNKRGKTALFYAKDPKYMYLLLSYGADPTHGRVGDFTLLEHLIRVKPENARALLNFELDTNDKESNDKEYLYIYRIRLMLIDKYNESTSSNTDEMTVMSRFPEFHQKTLLNAPTAEVYLHIKWNLIKKFYFLNSIIYLIYLISLTSLVYWTSYSKNHIKVIESSNVTIINNCSLSTLSLYEVFMKSLTLHGIWIALHMITFIFTLAVFGREMLQLCLNKVKYFKSKKNAVEFYALVSSLLYLLAVAFTGNSTCDFE